MTVEEAIKEIKQAPPKQRIAAIMALAESLQEQVLPTETIESNNQPNEKAEFKIQAFRMGKIDMPTREEIYDERTLQILGLD